MANNTESIVIGFDASYHNSRAKAETIAAQYGDIVMVCNACNARHIAKGWLACDVAEGLRDTTLLSKSCHACRSRAQAYIADDGAHYWEGVDGEENLYRLYGADPVRYEREVYFFRQYHDNRRARTENFLKSGEKFSRMVVPEEEFKAIKAEREKEKKLHDAKNKKPTAKTTAAAKK